MRRAWCAEGAQPFFPAEDMAVIETFLFLGAALLAPGCVSGQGGHSPFCHWGSLVLYRTNPSMSTRSPCQSILMSP